MKVIYVAHPLNHPTDEGRKENRRRGAEWAAWLAKTFSVAPVCDWIVLSSVWSEDEGRALGLEIDKTLIERCNGLFACGTHLSSGMAIEVEHAQSKGVPVFDGVALTFDETGRFHALREWIDRLPEARP